MKRLLIFAATLAFAPVVLGAAMQSQADTAKAPPTGAPRPTAAGTQKTPAASPKTASAGAVTAPVAPQHLVYDISRDGTPIGTNVVDIEKKGDVTSVNMTSDIEVKVLFVSAYTYRYNGTETWNEDQLAAFTSKTDDNGTIHNIVIHPAGSDRLDVEADGHHTMLPKTTGLDDFWCPQLLSKPMVLDTSDGHKMNFVAQDLGMETVAYRGAQHPARHFKLTGDVARDLWFDADTPVRFQIKARDGSMITSQLQ